ncbi:MAG: hypothetical protein K5651_03255 [Bacteroidales bacterium]|nr:hypothetical protein [Bacteroidales bacterium]
MLGPKKSPGRKCERTFFHGVSALSGAKRPERVEFAANSQIGLAFQASEGDNIDAVLSSLCIRTYANLVRQFGVIVFGSLAIPSVAPMTKAPPEAPSACKPLKIPKITKKSEKMQKGQKKEKFLCIFLDFLTFVNPVAYLAHKNCAYGKENLNSKL